MASVIQSNFRIRKNLGRVRRVIEVPNLIDIQKSSYDKFLQTTVPQTDRSDVGLQAVFRSVFPIKDFNGTSELVFVSYNLEKPKYDVEECRQRGMTYAAPIKVTTQLMIYDTRDGGERIVRDIKEQEVYFGEIPLMTDTGTFIINGTERVVVSQLHRSPGVFFDHDKGKTHSSGKVLYSARVIPYRGSWLDFEFDPRTSSTSVSIAEGRCTRPCSSALGYSTQDLLNYFYNTETVYLEKGGKISKSVEYELLAGQRATRDIKVGSDVVVKKNTKYTKAAIKKLRSPKIDRLHAEPEEIYGKVAAHDIVDKETGEVVIEVNEEVTEAKLEKLREAGIHEFKIPLHRRSERRQLSPRHAARREGEDDEDAIMEIYRRLRPGDPPTLETAKTLFQNLFFNPERYDLSKVGRLKLNYKFYRDLPEDQRPALDTQVLTPQDILETVRHLIRAEERPRVGGRYRPPRQPPRPRGRRADGEISIASASCAWSARSKSACRCRKRSTRSCRTTSSTRSRLRGGEGVLRQLAALAVHGPDEPALGGHATSVVSPRSGPAVSPASARASSARRAPDALRPHLPHRDAGGSEHRLIASLSTFARVTSTASSRRRTAACARAA